MNDPTDTDVFLAALARVADTEPASGRDRAVRDNARYSVAHDRRLQANNAPDKPNLDRLWICMMLGTTVDTCDALLQGRPVDASLLDQTWLRRFRRQGFVV